MKSVATGTSADQIKRPPAQDGSGAEMLRWLASLFGLCAGLGVFLLGCLFGAQVIDERCTSAFCRFVQAPVVMGYAGIPLALCALLMFSTTKRRAKNWLALFGAFALCGVLVGMANWYASS